VLVPDRFGSHLTMSQERLRARYGSHCWPDTAVSSTEARASNRGLGRGPARGIGVVRVVLLNAGPWRCLLTGHIKSRRMDSSPWTRLCRVALCELVLSLGVGFGVDGRARERIANEVSEEVRDTPSCSVSGASAAVAPSVCGPCLEHRCVMAYRVATWWRWLGYCGIRLGRSVKVENDECQNGEMPGDPSRID
jgi:hypothetical protein